MPTIRPDILVAQKVGTKLNTRLHDSVGDPKKGAVNRDEDVRTVQGLLNVQIVKDRRSDRFLAVDGRVGSETIGAIGDFQRRHNLARTELINREDTTIRTLAIFSGPRGMRASQSGIDLIKRYEQFTSQLYDNDGTAGNTTRGAAEG